MIEINKYRAIQLALGTVIMAFLGAALFEAVTKVGRVDVGVWYTLISMGVYFVALVLHELVHGAFFTYYGGHPKYGAGVAAKIMPYFYATSPGTRFTLPQMYIIGLSPFVLLSVVFIIGALLLPEFNQYFAIAFIGNFAGAIGDIWLMSQLVRFQRFKGVSVVDAKSGIEIHTSDPAAKKLSRKLLDKEQTSTSFGLMWAYGSLAMFILSVVALIAGQYFLESFIIGPEWFPLVEFKKTSEGSETSFSFLGPLVAGFLFAVFTKLFLGAKARIAGR
jgi:hypothetical protein